MGYYKKLPADFKAKWIEALRSGKYKQGKSRMYCDGAFCCLGIAGVVAGHSPTTLNEGHFVHLETAGIKVLVPDALIGDTQSRVAGKLMGMNDMGLSFDAIADWIEEKL